MSNGSNIFYHVKVPGHPKPLPSKQLHRKALVIQRRQEQEDCFAALKFIDWNRLRLFEKHFDLKGGTYERLYLPKKKIFTKRPFG